jgi:hypothetical protein
MYQIERGEDHYQTDSAEYRPNRIGKEFGIVFPDTEE